jgi:glycosyltransferase A (GT-A) superfamily protein (DUF2064 family)
VPRQVCAIGVMAKAPIAGRSKTRLCPPLLAEHAAMLSAAFLRDVTENIAAASLAAPIQGLIAYAPAGSVSLFDGHFAEGTGFVLADGLSVTMDDITADVTGFGRCLLHAIRSMFEEDFAAACVLNSDSPTLPTQFLADAADALLAPGDRVVLGPAEDGGYYMLGVKAPHARLFADIAWSSDSVADATRARARELGLDIVELPVWYDVDDRASLARLLHEIVGSEPAGSTNRYPARTTEAALRRIGLFAPDRAWAAQ